MPNIPKRTKEGAARAATLPASSWQIQTAKARSAKCFGWREPKARSGLRGKARRVW
jgi:hypothetical protein